MILITEIINLKIEDGKTEVVFKFQPIKINLIQNAVPVRKMLHSNSQRV